MKYYTLVANEQELAHLQMVYREHLKSSNDSNVLFVASHNQVTITAYKTGSIVLSGEDIYGELFAIKKMLNREDFEAIGSDEVGTGDVFGPVVVCAAYASVEDIEFLEKLNVRDSKNISDNEIVKMAPLIAKRLTHSLIILTPDKYNKLVEEGYNLNKIKAHLHNQALISLTAKLDNKEIPVIVDQFCTPNLYFNYLKDETLVYRDIQFYTKAENVHKAVAAAAIIARYGFLYSMQQCSKKVGERLLKGASKKVDEQLERIIDNKGTRILNDIAKTNFKNVTKLMS